MIRHVALMGLQLEELLPLKGVGPDPAEMVEGPKLHEAIANRGRQCLQAEVLLLLRCIGLGGAKGRWSCADRLAGREVLAQATRASTGGRWCPGRRLDPRDHKLVGGLEPTNRGTCCVRLVEIGRRSPFLPTRSHPAAHGLAGSAQNLLSTFR